MATSSDNSKYTSWSLDMIEDSGLTKESIEELCFRFNLASLAPYKDMPEEYIGHVYMCRPCLNLTDSNMKKLAQLPTTAGLLTNPYDKNIFKTLSSNSISKWLPIVTNRVKNYSVNDIELKTVDKSTTYYGHTIRYAVHNEDHKYGGTMSLDFYNDRHCTILRLMWFWMCYIYNVTKEDYLDIDFNYLWNGKLDYDASAFYLVTKRDGRELVYWEELVGLHPRKVPVSNFSWSNSYFSSNTVSIDFDYNIRRDPLDPGILSDINCLTLGTPVAENVNVIRKNPTGTMTMNDIRATGPVIVKGYNSNGDTAYFLEHTWNSYVNNSYHLEKVSSIK